MGRIIVQVDPEIFDLVPKYLEARRADILTIQTALDKGDFTLISHLSHIMKGSGGGYGMDPVTEIGGRMEDAALRKDYVTVHSQFLLLRDYLTQVEIVAA